MASKCPVCTPNSAPAAPAFARPSLRNQTASAGLIRPTYNDASRLSGGGWHGERGGGGGTGALPVVASSMPTTTPKQGEGPGWGQVEGLTGSVYW